MSKINRCPHCGGSVPGKARFCQSCGKDVTRGKALPTRLIALVLTVVIVLAGVGFAGLHLARPKAPGATESPKERPTQIAGAGQMPVWLLSADHQVQDDYVWAAAHLAELQYMPCYCGCGAFGHGDNFGCYFKRNQDGTITGYDNHAVG